MASDIDHLAKLVPKYISLVYLCSTESEEQYNFFIRLISKLNPLHIYIYSSVIPRIYKSFIKLTKNVTVYRKAYDMQVLSHPAVVYAPSCFPDIYAKVIVNNIHTFPKGFYIIGDDLVKLFIRDHVVIEKNMKEMFEETETLSERLLLLKALEKHDQDRLFANIVISRMKTYKLPASKQYFTYALGEKFKTYERLKKFLND